MIQAIVLRTIPWREHDRLVVLYSGEQGKLWTVARGAQRASSRQAPALDPGTLLQCDLVVGRVGPILTGAQAIRSWASAKQSPLRWSAALFFLEAVDALVYDGQPDRALWDCLRDALGALDQAGDGDVGVTLAYHQELLLTTLGYARTSNDTLEDTFTRIAERHLSALSLYQHLARGIE